MKLTLNRRRILGVAVSGAAVICIGHMPNGGGAAADTLSHPDLLHILDDAQRILALGLAYREQFPHEARADTLHAAIVSSCAVPNRCSTRQLRAALQHRIRSDFLEGRSVQLHGWILALTEARQCALYSLLQT